MKLSQQKWFPTIMILVCVTLVSSCQLVSKPAGPLKTVKIIYKIENKISDIEMLQKLETQETLSIDLENMRMHKETIKIVKIGTTETKTRDLEIYDGKKLYKITSHEDKKATFQEVDYSLRAPWTPLFISMQEPKREDTFLGKPCSVYESEQPEMKNEAWVWNNIGLKTVQEFGDSRMTKEAISIEENPKFSESFFQLPSDVKAIDYREHQKKMWDKTKKYMKRSTAPFKTAHITYKIQQTYSHKGREIVTNQKENVFIDTVNSKVRRVTVTPPKRKGEKPYKQIALIKDEKQYRWSSRKPEEVVYNEFFNLQPWGTFFAEQYFKKEGKFLRKPVKIYESETVGITTRKWIWSGIELKSVMETKDGTTKKWAIKIRENVKINPKLFETPASARLIHQDEKTKEAQRMVKEAQKKIEAMKNKK